MIKSINVKDKGKYSKMFDSLFRRFSIRKAHRLEKKKKLMEPPLPQLTPPLILDIIDQMSFFDQLRMQGVCKHVEAYIKQKLRMITKLDVRKQNIDEATSSGKWDRHGNAYVAVRIENDTIYMIIDEQWVNVDLKCLLSCMEVFHEWIEEVTLDAPIIELLVVSMSNLKLEIWYLFQCLMKVYNDFEDRYDYETDFISDRETYWPNVRELTIRTKACQANFLSRVLDYGVKSGFVMDRRTLDKLRLVFCDLDSLSNPIVKKHAYHFRCWAGSVGWDHRYEAQFLGSKDQTSV